MFFQLFLGGITLKIIPSENGSSESTSSSSALPPSVIICARGQRGERTARRRRGSPATHLVHLLELHRDDSEALHELAQAQGAEVVRELLRGVALLCDGVEVRGALHELLLASGVLLEDGEVEAALGNPLCGRKHGSGLGRTQSFAAGTDPREPRSCP